ncbi:MAG: siphovirus Gp157 family protein [Xenococcus sp. MO_188.B8]|nr:siphovirus Gp157 family protein [Xenococcus sp. MO_188.B8]
MTKSTRLWELSDNIQQLETAISDLQEDETLSEEELENQLQQTFNKWLETGESFKVKAEEVAAYIRHQEALAEARKAEAKRIQALAKQAENGAARLRKYLMAQMIRSDVKKIDGTTVKIGLRKKQPQILINVPPEELPDEYVKVTYKANLTEIRKLLKSDSDIGWASFSESHEYSVTIH